MDPACWLWKKKGSRLWNQVSEETSPYLLLGAQDQRLGVEQDQLPCGSTWTPSGNCQETETCMFRACHTPWQPLQNHPSGHLGVRATPWSAEEMLDAWQNCPKGPPAGKTGRGSLLNRPSCPPTTQSVKGLNWTELNHGADSSGTRRVTRHK